MQPLRPDKDKSKAKVCFEVSDKQNTQYLLMHGEM